MKEILQIRISLPEFSSGVSFSDPIILENADNIQLVQSVNLAQESISFTLPHNDAKVTYLSEREVGVLAYLRWWECWDTETNTRLGYGPIDSIEDSSGSELKISGPSRYALLRDFSKTVQTFFYPISQFLDDLRYENLAGEPRTSTLINDADGTDFHGLSTRTKDNVIDENIGFLSPGRDTPARGQLKTNSYWAGTGKADYLTVDLGDTYTISKVRVLLPWWGGLTINNNRSYDWTLDYSTDDAAYTIVYDTGTNSHKVTAPDTKGTSFYMGEDGFERDKISVSATPIPSRFWKIDISNTHAYYGVGGGGNNFPASTSDEWNWECAGSNVFQGGAYNSPSTGTLNQKTLQPDNDCYASVVEVEIDRKILSKDFLSSIYYQQIENENLQITYVHSPDASETIDTTVAQTRKYEPGVVFRTATFTWATTGGSLDVYDDYNVNVYSTAAGSGTHSLTCPANTKFLRFVGSTDVVVTSSDCWIGKLDPLSFGGRYSYSTIVGDTAVIHFRGVSVRWYITVPDAVAAGQVSIEIRSKSGATWSSWATLEAALNLPINVAAEKVWEITYESGTLANDTTYEVRITNLNGGYVGIDAFAGYWQGSFQQLNEDDPRFYVRFPNNLRQFFQPEYSFQSLYEYPVSTPAFTRESLVFKGDRVIIYSLRNPGAGTFKIKLIKYTGTTSSQVIIPGGDVDGGYTFDLNHSTIIRQAVIFDSDVIFGPDGLEWGTYLISFFQRNDSTGPMYLDGVGFHGESGLSTKFEVTSYLQILQDTCTALTMEPQITENGLRVVPRIGVETNEVVRDGEGVTVNIDDVKDISQVATMLQITGSDIDGLPLTALIEDKITKKLFGRTIQRPYDLRNVADYFTLIGAGRTELIKRRTPQNRVSINATHINFGVGDSFSAIKALTQFRLRAISVARNQSRAGGTSYSIDCLEIPRELSSSATPIYTIPVTSIPSSLPSAPSSLSETPGDTSVSLTWSPV